MIVLLLKGEYCDDVFIEKPLASSWERIAFSIKYNCVQHKIFNTACSKRQFWQARLLTYHTYNAYLFKSNLIHNLIFIQLTVCCLSQNLFRLTFLNTKIKHNLDQQTIYTVWPDEFTINIMLKWTRSYRFRSVILIKMFNEWMYAVF